MGLGFRFFVGLGFRVPGRSGGPRGLHCRHGRRGAVTIGA